MGITHPMWKYRVILSNLIYNFMNQKIAKKSFPGIRHNTHMCRTPPSSPSVTSCATSVTTATRTKLSPPSLKLLDLKRIKLQYLKSDWMIESTMIPVTLVPTNDGAVHNHQLHSYLYFLFLLKSCTELLHEKTNSTLCTKALSSIIPSNQINCVSNRNKHLIHFIVSCGYFSKTHRGHSV